MSTAVHRQCQGGFTLVELMVVVAIIGGLGSLAAVRFSTQPNVNKAAVFLALQVADASREAREAGPVVDTVVSNEGLGSFRSQVRISSDSFGQYVAVELRLEDSDTASSNHELSRSYLPQGTVIVGREEGVARTDPGGVSTNFTTYDLRCSANGVCGPITFFLDSSSNNDKYRVVVMPLSSMPLVLNGW